MRMTGLLKNTCGALKRTALGLAVGAAALLGVGLTAQAATTNSTINLGANQASGTALASGVKVLKIAKGTLPAGSILRSVAISAVEYTWQPYTSDICVFFAVSSTASGTLRIGDNPSGGAPAAATQILWGSGIDWNYGDGYTLNKTVTTGIPAIDLNGYDVFLTSGYSGTWSGTITLTYDEPADPNTLKDITDFTFPTYGAATISGTAISITVPYGTAVTALSPTYVHNGASASPASGSSRNFTTPQTYTVYDLNSATKEYTVTVNVAAPVLTYNFTDGLQGWIQIYAGGNNGNVWNSGGKYLGSWNADGDNTYFARSPVFYLIGSGDLTFQLAGGQSALAAPGVAPSVIPQNAIDGGGFGGAALRDVETDTYVMSARRSGSADQWQTQTFTAAQLSTYANNGRAYTLDYIDYNKGGWGWTVFDNVSIPGSTIQPGAQKNITDFTFPTFGAATISGTNITLAVPYGTVLTSLTPTVTITGVSVSPASGVATDFSNPVTYTVTASDDTTKAYRVTVTVAGPSSAKDILAFSFGALGDAAISGTSITKTVPTGTSLSSLAPTYTLSSPVASGSPASGTARNFNTAQTYQITAQDGSTQDYTVTVTKSSAGPLITMVVNARTPGISGSTVSGPAGSTPYWNYPSPAITDNGQDATKANMVDSTGAGTGIGFSIHMPSNDPWGNPALEMLKTGLFNPGWGDWGQCEINGLTAGKIYNLFIASARINDNERSKGTFRMLNVADKATADVDCSKDPVTGLTYPNNNGGPRNGSTWVEGNNYVAFRSVVADAQGKILFTANENCAPHLLINGFQLQEVFVEPPAPTGTFIMIF